MNDHVESLALDSEDDIVEEAKRSWEVGKVLGLSSSNGIDMIWALAKNRKD